MAHGLLPERGWVVDAGDCHEATRRLNPGLPESAFEVRHLELRQTVLAFFLARHFDLLSGHLPYSPAVHREYADEYAVFTVLREPLARLRSHVAYLVFAMSRHTREAWASGAVDPAAEAEQVLHGAMAPWLGCQQALYLGGLNAAGQADLEGLLPRAKAAVVDLGSFLGGAAAVLAEGLRRNPRLADTSRRVHLHDAWVMPDDGWLLALAGRAYPPGQDFAPLARAKLQPWAEHLVWHRGNLAQAVWEGGPIELLVIDAAVCWSTTQAILDAFLPHLIPGRSVVVFLDQDSPYNPWIHALMAHGAASFRPLVRRDSARAWLCVAPIPAEARVDLRRELSHERRLELLDEALAEGGRGVAPHLHAAKSMLAFMERGLTEGLACLAEARGRIPGLRPQEHALLDSMEAMYRVWQDGAALERDMATKVSRWL